MVDLESPYRWSNEGVAPPLVRLFAEVPTILAAQGEPPARGSARCVEAAAWLVQHPGCPSYRMSMTLGLAEGSRRATLSKLRWWLGTAPDGGLHLPLAYQGTVSLAPRVTSDFALMRRLVTGGVDHVPRERLEAALDLIQGPFLGNQRVRSHMWGWADDTARRLPRLVGQMASRAASLARAENDWDRFDWVRDRARHVLSESELFEAMEPPSAIARGQERWWPRAEPAPRFEVIQHQPVRVAPDLGGTKRPFRIQP